MKKNYNFVFFIAALTIGGGFLSTIVRGQEYPQQVTPPVANQVTTRVLSSFRNYAVVQSLPIVVPTTVSVSVPITQRMDAVVVAIGTQTIEPSYVNQNTVVKPVAFNVSADAATPGTIGYILDKNAATYAEFPLPASGEGVAEIVIASAEPITSSSFSLILDSNVALPKFIELTTQSLGSSNNTIVIAKRAFASTVISFPSTTAQVWRLRLTYDQPLRIAELTVSQPNAERSTSREVRFLGQPGQHYQIYFDADKPVTTTTGEAGNLSYATDVVHADLTIAANPLYQPADIDLDGIADVSDNCPSAANADQKDANSNGIGDACEDFDHDNIMNDKDNCIEKPNRDQADADGDHIGDVCDTLDNRFTEQHKWIPWVGIGSAAVVLVILFGLTARSMQAKKD